MIVTILGVGMDTFMPCMEKKKVQGSLGIYQNLWIHWLGYEHFYSYSFIYFCCLWPTTPFDEDSLLPFFLFYKISKEKEKNDINGT